MRLLFDADAMTAAGLDTRIHVLASGSVIVEIHGMGSSFHQMMEGVIDADRLADVTEKAGFSKQEASSVGEELLSFVYDRMIQKFIFSCAEEECKKYDRKQTKNRK